MSEVAASVTLCLDSVEVVSVMISLEFVVTKDLFSSGLVVTSLVDGLMTSVAFSSMLFQPLVPRWGESVQLRTHSPSLQN